ncbi:xanthine dehydrogenase family protein molybdopterin-binding subunit [Plantactinospora sonchi]|uniref:Xanthine dehydrogenase family protein molybdopterin-binding subunit n=1 Tax=Plantactinospora sonchi TaxID=1544735 RepID=A0ABU7RQJ1_9ACTN
MSRLVGRDVERVDGRAKVTGAARYAADQPVPDPLHGYLVLSTIARGEVTGIDTTAARARPGVVAVLTHADLPKLTVPGFPYLKGFIPMQDTRIHHDGQPVALVLAETWEQAREAAGLVRVDYRAETPKAVIADAAEEAILPRMFREKPNEFRRGDPEAALAGAPVTVDVTYTSPTHHHNPIEPHASTAVWEGGRLTLYETAQGVNATRGTVADILGVLRENVRVVSPYLGGGFGTKSPTWPHTVLAAVAAQLVGRPVRIVLTRAQMYTSVGHRSQFHQRLRIGATRQGRLTAISHTSTAQLSRTDEGVFNVSESSLLLYACPNVHVRQQGVRLDLPTSNYMRSPEMSAHFGLETALDELSHALGVDPLELRLRNHTDVNQQTGQRFSSKYLTDCYRMAAAAFGWSRRDPRPGATRDGDEFVGWGMATETHSYGHFPATAGVTVGTDGRAAVRLATQDIGTGTYTVVSQVAAEALGLPLTHVTAMIGDTALPVAGLSAASATVASVTGSVDQAARLARDAVVRLAVADARSPLYGLPPGRVVSGHGDLVDRERRDRRDSYRAVMGRAGRPVEVTGTVPNVPGHAYGVVFVEVRVHARYGRVRVTRVVTAHDAGRVLNRRTLRGQVLGGVTWGIGYALTERTVLDRRTARVVNANLSSYLLPVCADVPRVETLFVDRKDPVSTALGARGFGETPITGVPAAIGNAIFHATGRRLRDLPFTQDKLL